MPIENASKNVWGKIQVSVIVVYFLRTPKTLTMSNTTLFIVEYILFYPISKLSLFLHTLFHIINYLYDKQ